MKAIQNRFFSTWCSMPYF